jgi:hypothetical protein
MSHFSNLPEHPDWDYLDITYTEAGQPTIEGSTVRVPVRHIEVIEGFPGHKQSQLYSQCTLVFSGVVRSVCKISEYTDATQRGFKPTYTRDDGPFPESQAPVFRCLLDVWSYDPKASIYWVIIAERVHIEDGVKQAYSM